MDIQISKSLVEVSMDEFKDLISNIDWVRDGWSNCDRYYLRYSQTLFGATDAKRTRAWVDPTFFKRAQ